MQNSIRRGVATFTLDWGKCPKWLFERMVKLGREIAQILIAEYGPEEFIRRLADPVWFQSLGTVLAFDWNASGLTTTLTAALKEAIRGEERNLGVFICGGKGKTSRKTPDEIKTWGEHLALPEAKVENLVYNSRMSAKVDSSLIQDGYGIYHHTFFFSKSGAWTVVQQGMNLKNQTARRYHWFSKNFQSLVCEPHTGIASQLQLPLVLDLTSRKSQKTQEVSVDLATSGYKTLLNDLQLLRKHSSNLSQMLALKKNREYLTLLNLENTEFKAHPVMQESFAKSKYLEKILWQISQNQPENYEKLLALKGVGPLTIRALALVAEIIYGAKPSWEDPARYSFAHGGKDATPYPVDRNTYDQTIQILKKAVTKTKIGPFEKQKIFQRLDV